MAINKVKLSSDIELKDRLVAINRVTKVTKGGSTFRFVALVVVGDEKGRVGCGMGKAVEIPEAIRKGCEDAKKQMINVPMNCTTIPHEVVGVFGTGKVNARTNQIKSLNTSWNLRAFNGVVVNKTLIY